LALTCLLLGVHRASDLKLLKRATRKMEYGNTKKSCWKTRATLYPFDSIVLYNPERHTRIEWQF
jgi:hypothetical protein